MQSVKSKQLNSNFLPKLNQDSKLDPKQELIDGRLSLKQKSFMTPQTDKKFDADDNRRLSHFKWQQRLENVWNKSRKNKLQFPELDGNLVASITDGTQIN